MTEAREAARVSASFRSPPGPVDRRVGSPTPRIDVTAPAPDLAANRPVFELRTDPSLLRLLRAHTPSAGRHTDQWRRVELSFGAEL